MTKLYHTPITLITNLKIGFLNIFKNSFYFAADPKSIESIIFINIANGLCLKALPEYTSLICHICEKLLTLLHNICDNKIVYEFKSLNLP